VPTIAQQDSRPAAQDVLCVAQVRPTTGRRPIRTIGWAAGSRWKRLRAVGCAAGRPNLSRGDPDWDGDLPVRREAIPVRRDGAIVALLSRDTNLASARSPSALELAYLQGAAELCHMIAEGSFPAPGEDPEVHAGPRVGDGLLRLDVDGTVTYASPNALSAYRRLGVTGDVRGIALASLTQSLSSDPFDGRGGRRPDLAVARGVHAAADGGRGRRRDDAGAGAAAAVLPGNHAVRWCWSGM